MEQPASDLESVGTNNLSQDGSPRKPITTVTEQPLLEEKGSTPTILHEPDVSDRTQNDEQATPGSLISNTDLKLDLSENLDHEDFSKLLELESKNDDDLFSSTDILVSNVPGENGVLTGEQPAISETASKSENEQIPSPTASVSHLEVSQGVKFMDPDQPLIDPIPEVDLKDNGRLTQDATSTTGNTREGTVTSVFEEHGDILYDKAHDSLASSALEQQGLPHDPLDNPMGDMPHDMSTGIHLPMTQFHDSNINDDEQSKISAYARLDFQSFTFYVQTLQVIIGRRSENDYSHKVDVNLGPSKSISRKHAQIFYNFGTGRFELSIMGKNGAFVDDTFVERGITVPLKNKTKVQIGQIPFQFVLPEQDGKDRKSIDPADAISLKTALVSNNKIAELSRSSTPQPMPAASVTTSQQEDAEDPGKDKPTPKKKDKKLPKPPKPPKKIYTLEEIPPEYRTKPACSYSNLITTCLRKFSSPKGMSLSEIYAGIRDLFPYYKYCPDGWQSSVRHNLSLNKSFRKVSKEGKGWLWGLDEEYIAERERQKKKQAEAAAAKAKAAQLKLEQQQQQKAKKAAAAAAAAAAVANDNGSGMRSAVNIPLVRPTAKQPNISQTLAANRADRKASADANQRTMKYLQEQLMILTKDRKGLDKQVMASILTQALAMTINQVTQAAKTKGITGNPLTALIDKNPQHLNLILAAAVNAATVKVTNGEVKQLVAMPPPTNTQSPLKKESTPMHKVGPSPTASNQSSNQFVGTGASSDGFDPSSLSKFFQPKQPARAPTPVQPRSVIPQKRTSSDTDSSSDEESTSEDESGSDGSDSDDSNTEGGGESTDNSSSSDEDTTDEE